MGEESQDDVVHVSSDSEGDAGSVGHQCSKKKFSNVLSIANVPGL